MYSFVYSFPWPRTAFPTNFVQIIKVNDDYIYYWSWGGINKASINSWTGISKVIIVTK